MGERIELETNLVLPIVRHGSRVYFRAILLSLDDLLGGATLTISEHLLGFEEQVGHQEANVREQLPMKKISTG